MTAVKNAQMAESPVLLIGGAAATLLKGRGALQDMDQMVLFRPLCKFCATVRRLRDIKPTITHALHVAQSGTPGTQSQYHGFVSHRADTGRTLVGFACLTYLLVSWWVFSFCQIVTSWLKLQKSKMLSLCESCCSRRLLK